jgi:molybdenum cofactor cytidylyltransferase
MPYVRAGELADFMEQTIASGRVAGCVTQEGHLKNPVMFHTSLEPELLALTGDTGGKAVFRRHQQEAFTYEWRGCLRDIDYREEL